MKRVICYVPIFAIAMASLVSGCVDQDKDFYDGTSRTSNPMGDDFVAPDNFDWSAVTTSKVTVNANDEFNGQYFYVIEIYSANPILFPQTTQLLGKGAAKASAPYSSEIVCPKGVDNIYIKQIDPRGRAIVKTTPFSSTINFSFASHVSTVKATTRNNIATRADVDMPKYDKIPDDATEVKGSAHNDWFKDGKNYKITGNYNGGIYHSGTSTTCKLFISGTWTVPANAENWTSTFNTGIEVIIMPGGKIICNNSGLEFNGKAKLIIMPNGVLECQSLYATNTVEYYNSGSISVKDFIKMDSGSQIFNNCLITAQNLFNCDGAIINMNQGTIIANKFQFNNATVNLNNGSMLKGEEIHNISKNNYSNSENNRSLIKAAIIGYGWGGANYKGNITIETDNIKKINGNSLTGFDEWEQQHQMSSYYKTDSKINETGYDQSNVVIASCSGIENEGNEGHEPSNPDFPIIMEDNQNYTYLFEDQWPLYGDYDLNDIVLNLNKRKIDIAKNGKVEEAELEFELRAVGALNNIAAAIMLDHVPASAITSEVEIEDFEDSQSIFNLTDKNIEAKQSNVVIPLFGNAHKLMGQSINTFVNTISGSPNNVNKYPKIEITIKFDTPTLSPEVFNVNNLNLFIITDQSAQRKEIHIAGFQPTALASTSMFGKNDDGSVNGKYYVSKENLAWAFMVPQQFKWTLEKNNIKDAYSKFKTWVTSGGKEEPNWWNTFDHNKTFQNNKN